jgi:hypothetical protein
MPPAGTIVIVLLVLVFIIGFVIPLARGSKTVKESFMTSLDEYNKYSREDMVSHGQKMYNKFSDSQDVRLPTFITSDDPDDIAAANMKIRQAFYTADANPDGTLKPVPNTNTFNPAFKTLMATTASKVTAQLPPPNGLITMAKKCETMTTRDSCVRMDDPDFKYCGVCIDEGTTHTEKSPGAHIGGLLVLPNDRADAEDAASQNGTPVVYKPTVGQCPPGKFFVRSDECTKQSNRLNCLEVGQTGGFISGQTKEGKDATTASCAQVPTMGEDVYVYNPPERTYSINLRVLTPLGTGKSAVYVRDTTQKVLLASNTNISAGVDAIVTINGVKELQELYITVQEEVPMRRGGRAEVFLFNENGAAENQTKDSAEILCQRIGTQLATKEQLDGSWRKGAQNCKKGHTANGIFHPAQARNPVRTMVTEHYDKGRAHKYEQITYPCGDGDGKAVFADKGDKANAWCFGVKPPEQDRKVSPMNYYIGKFFDTFGENSTPKQGASIYSEYDNDPDEKKPMLIRAVLLQWEMSTDSVKRNVPFEPTISTIDKYPVTSEGGKAVLNIFGTFNGSTVINQPKPGNSQIMRSTRWLWGQDAKKQTVEFFAQVPGVLLDPVYKEDIDVAARGPLLNKRETQTLLHTSPCLKEGQVAGNYGMTCLLSLFTGVGGDPINGKLAKLNGGLSQLNSIGDSDAIEAYLYNLYSLARTGRDADGNKPSGNQRERRAVINDASQKLYGFDIASPCEEIVTTESGEIQLRPKDVPLDSECLNHLWLNTGSDKDRYNEDRTGSVIGNTYISIGDRFSGLMNSEGTQDDRDKYPFQACQLKGSLAPIQDGTRNLRNMAEANAKGSVKGVQDFYNTVFKTANYSRVPKDQTLAMQQCYGVGRNPKAADATACSIATRYVRVLSNSLGNAAPQSVIMIPQIQVFDNNGDEVAKGKPTSSHNGNGQGMAVNGNATPHTHGEGEYHANGNDLDNEYWMVDLGRVVQVQEVRFYNRTDCCEQYGDYRHLGMPIQLLDASKQVVAEKLVGSTNWPSKWGQMESIVFTEMDKKPMFPISQIMAGLRISLRSAIHFNRILRHASGSFYLSDPDMAGGNYSPLMRNDGTLKITDGQNGMSDHYSFESANLPGYYLGHSKGVTRVTMSPLRAYDGRDYADIISFKPVPALNGNPSMVSWKSGYLNKRKGSYADHYIAIDKDDSHKIIMDKTDGSLRDLERFCWTIFPGLA